MTGNGAQAPELVTLSCTACGATVMADPVSARTARLWHHGDGTHLVINPAAARSMSDAYTLRAHVLALAVRLQDLADDVAELAGRLP